jgi:hypothetical protein
VPNSTNVTPRQDRTAVRVTRHLFDRARKVTHLPDSTKEIGLVDEDILDRGFAS